MVGLLNYSMILKTKFEVTAVEFRGLMHMLFTNADNFAEGRQPLRLMDFEGLDGYVTMSTKPDIQMVSLFVDICKGAMEGATLAMLLAPLLFVAACLVKLSKAVRRADPLAIQALAVRCLDTRTEQLAIKQFEFEKAEKRRAAEAAQVAVAQCQAEEERRAPAQLQYAPPQTYSSGGGYASRGGGGGVNVSGPRILF